MIKKIICWLIGHDYNRAKMIARGEHMCILCNRCSHELWKWSVAKRDKPI